MVHPHSSCFLEKGACFATPADLPFKCHVLVQDYGLVVVLIHCRPSHVLINIYLTHYLTLHPILLGQEKLSQKNQTHQHFLLWLPMRSHSAFGSQLVSLSQTQIHVWDGYSPAEGSLVCSRLCVGHYFVFSSHSLWSVVFEWPLADFKKSEKSGLGVFTFDPVIPSFSFVLSWNHDLF